jgi:hypothetical protein
VSAKNRKFDSVEFMKARSEGNIRALKRMAAQAGRMEEKRVEIEHFLNTMTEEERENDPDYKALMDYVYSATDLDWNVRKC